MHVPLHRDGHYSLSNSKAEESILKNTYIDQWTQGKHKDSMI